MQVIEFGALTAARRSELEGDEDDPFGSRGNPLHYRPKDLHVALQDKAGRLVASTGIVVVEAEVEEERFPVVGLGGVIVTEGQRGRGLGRRVIEAALRKAETLGPAFALLFCYDDRMGLYRKLGFAEVAAEVVVEQPTGPALREDSRWPPGSVILHSLPF
jgi:predicted N-acetyltransferase YhbS